MSLCYWGREAGLSGEHANSIASRQNWSSTRKSDANVAWSKVGFPTSLFPALQPPLRADHAPTPVLPRYDLASEMGPKSRTTIIVSSGYRESAYLYGSLSTVNSRGKSLKPDEYITE
ncbi:hypothetical protein AVEN_100860-1 [Araneus ventricosus]|uniref:Uncharacterized protein n=1 Tax=Araneus ventricosus TaxID=182803 RepID=A0A4Y2AY81_ARAVE|nr:hypothetical protein AVEN_100860-1 [Araneus ventricosus]